MTPYEDVHFNTRVLKTDSCWLWTGFKMKNGYGSLASKTFKGLAHRWSWILHFGEIPTGKLVLHKCDNPPCVNPDHLFIGSHKDNTDDARQKGRLATGNRHGLRLHPDAAVKGERHHQAKLSESQVLEIRSVYNTVGTTCKSLGKKYGVSRSTIERVGNQKLWKSITNE